MTDVYKIAVSLAMTSNAPAFMSALSSQILHVHGQVGKLQGSLAQLNRTKLAIGGGLFLAGGAAALTMLKGVADHGDKLLDQQDKLHRAGVSLNETLRLQADYYSRVAKSLPTSTASEYLKTVQELRAVTGPGAEGLAKAAAMTPKAMMVDALLSNTFHRDAGGDYYKLLRSAEMKGISTNDEKREDFIDKAFSYIVGFGGKLTANDYQLMARRGGTAFMNADLEKALGPLSVMGADLGGSAAGTALMTLQQFQMGAHTLSKQQGAELESLGLLDMSKTTKTGFGGGRLQLKPGAMIGSLEHAGDLPGWIKDIVYPALERSSHGDFGLLQSSLAKIMPDRNAAKTTMMFGSEGFLDQQMKDMGLAKGVQSIPDAYKSYTTNNPLGVKDAFHKQYESMMQAIGAPLMQAALPVMKGVTSMFTDIGDFANKHPEAIKMIGTGIAALGAALIGAGAIALIAAIGTGGWLIAGIVALGAAVVKFWPEIKGFFSGFGDSIQSLATTFGNFLLDIKNWPSEIAAALKAIGPALLQGILSIFKFGGGSGNPETDGVNNPNFIPGAYHGGVGSARLYRASLGGAANSNVPNYGGGAGGAGSSMYDAIMRAEGTAGKDPYNVVLGNGAYGLPSKPLTSMTLAEAYAFGRTVRARHGSSSALGAFQIVGSTMRAAASSLGFDWQHDRFDQRHQQAMAAWIREHQGLGAWEGFKTHPSELARARRGSMIPPTAGAPPAKPADTHIHELHVDGKIMAQAVSKHRVADGRFPTSVGGPDTHGHFTSPGTPINDAA